MPEFKAIVGSSIAVLAVCSTSQLSAQSFDGLYHPNWGNGAKWTCTADSVGSDGGAMQISGTQLFDVETRCSLDNPMPVIGTEIVKYAASCSVEGSTSQSTMFLATYDKGVFKADENGIADWRSCDFVTEQNDPSSFIGPMNFLGQPLDFNNLLGQDLTPLYWYSHSLCRGTIPSWPEAISDNACELRQSISNALLAKGFRFDQSEQIWLQTFAEQNIGPALPNHLIPAWQRLDQACRGNSGSQVATQAQCLARDAVLLEIGKYDVCFGQEDQASTEYGFHNCIDGSFPIEATALDLCSYGDCIGAQQVNAALAEYGVFIDANSLAQP